MSQEQAQHEILNQIPAQINIEKTTVIGLEKVRTWGP
jgi:hypothetical protein